MPGVSHSIVMNKTTKIVIPRTGIAAGTNQPRAIYDVHSNKVLQALGNVSTMRASNVEPGSNLSLAAVAALPADMRNGEQLQPKYANLWFADMLPVGGPVLGPYDDRDSALSHEVAWLEANNVPVCVDCRAASPT